MKLKFFIATMVMFLISGPLFVFGNTPNEPEKKHNVSAPTEVQMSNVIESYTASGMYDQKTFSANGSWAVSIVNHGNKTIHAKIYYGQNGTLVEEFDVAPNTTVGKGGTLTGELWIVLTCSGNMNAYVSVSH